MLVDMEICAAGWQRAPGVEVHSYPVRNIAEAFWRDHPPSIPGRKVKVWGELGAAAGLPFPPDIL